MNDLYGGFGSTPIDDDILSMFGGTPSLTKPQAQANALRTVKPKRESTSITQNVAEQSPSTPPMGAAQTRSALGQQAMGQIEAAQAEIDKYSGPQDYTAMQDYAKQRAGSGQKSLLVSLAAQAAGKEYAPIGAQYLKRAMDMREPLKTATGFITEQGQHIEDPQAQAMQRVKVAEAKMARAQQILQSNASAEEKAAAQREALELRREIAEGNQALRAATIAAAGAARAGAGDARQWRVEDGMAKQYDALTKDIRAELDATRKVKQLAPTMLGRRPNAIEQQSMIVLLNKFLDPGSVVREGEFDRVAQAQGYVQRAQNLMNRIANGELMSDTLIQQIGQMADFYDQAARSQLQARGDAFWQKAERRGLDPSNVVVDPDYKPRSGAAAGPPEGAVRVKGAPAPAAAAPTAGGPPPGAVRVKGQ